MIFWVIIVLNKGVVFKQVVLVEEKGHVLAIMLNKPHKLNIANREMVR
jgi:enoyl-CoA hydratase/carnithine racemase